MTATPDSVSDWLLTEYLSKRGGRFNYNPSINTLFDLFSGIATYDSAVRHCSTTGNPAGRHHNADAIRKVAPYTLENRSTCYRIGFSAIAVGRLPDCTVFIGIKTPMVIVVRPDVFVVMPGFRMSHRPVEGEIDVACSIALATFARDDFAKADFEYLYAGPGHTGEREFHVFRGRDRRIYDRDAVDHLLDIYVKGVSLAIKSGAAAERPDLHGYRIIDPSAPSLF